MKYISNYGLCSQGPKEISKTNMDFCLGGRVNDLFLQWILQSLIRIYLTCQFISLGFMIETVLLTRILPSYQNPLLI